MTKLQKWDHTIVLQDVTFGEYWVKGVKNLSFFTTVSDTKLSQND